MPSKPILNARKKFHAKEGSTAKDGHSESTTGTYGPKAYLDQWISKVKPGSYLPQGVVMEDDLPSPEIKGVGDADALGFVTKMIGENPEMSAMSYLNLMKAQGVKFLMPVAETDSTSTNVGLVREAAAPKTGNITFKSGKFLEAIGTNGRPDAAFTRFKTVLLSEGLGNLRDLYFYSRQALESAVPVFEGKKIFSDHPTAIEEKIRPERSVRDVLGHFENVHIEEGEDGQALLVGDVVIPPDEPFVWARSLMGHAVDYAKKYPDKDFVGLSINASGDANDINIDQLVEQGVPQGALVKLQKAKEQGNENVKLVTVIADAVSCDLVCEAGAGGKILELMEAKSNMEMDHEMEGGPGSGRHKGGGKADPKTAAKKPAVKAIAHDQKAKTDHVLKKANDFEKSGKGFFSRNSDGSMTMNVRDPGTGGSAHWDNAHAFVKSLGAYGNSADIQPDKMSGHLTVKVPKVYTNESKKESYTPKEILNHWLQILEGDKEMSKKKDTKKLFEADQKKDGAEDSIPSSDKAMGADGSDGGEHTDEQQDIDLIKKMIAKYLSADAMASEEECGMVKEAYEACTEMGMPENEAAQTAVKQLQLAKHMAAKQQKQAVNVDSDKGVVGGSPAEGDQMMQAEEGKEDESESESHKESAASLAGENARLKSELKKYQTTEHLDKMLEASKLPTHATKQFRTLVKDAKGTDEVTKMFKVFEAAYRSSNAAGKVDFAGVHIQPEKSVQAPTSGKAAGLFNGITRT